MVQKTPQGSGGQAAAKKGNLPLPVGAEKVPSPKKALLLAFGEVARGKAAQKPEPVLVFDLERVERSELQVADAASQGLRSFSQKVERGRA